MAIENICKADNCENEYKTKGYCNKHYQRFLKTGKLDCRFPKKIISRTLENGIIEFECTKCKIFKTQDFFYKKPSTGTYLRQCDTCQNKIKNDWLVKNKEKRKISSQKYTKKNSEKLNEYGRNYNIKNKNIRKLYVINNKQKLKEDHAVYYKKNKSKINAKNKEKYKLNRDKISSQNKISRLRNSQSIKNYKKRKYDTDILYNINVKMSRSILFCLKNNKNGRHWECLVGYAKSDLEKRLKKTMPKGYTWQDFLKGELHIDHIIPKRLFIYTSPDCLSFKKCWALSNLQLLPKKENLEKGGNYNLPFQYILPL